jgi:hypothetical protein
VAAAGTHPHRWAGFGCRRERGEGQWWAVAGEDRCTGRHACRGKVAERGALLMWGGGGVRGRWWLGGAKQGSLQTHLSAICSGLQRLQARGMHREVTSRLT